MLHFVFYFSNKSEQLSWSCTSATHKDEDTTSYIFFLVYSIFILEKLFKYKVVLVSQDVQFFKWKYNFLHYVLWNDVGLYDMVKGNGLDVADIIFELQEVANSHVLHRIETWKNGPYPCNQISDCEGVWICSILMDKIIVYTEKSKLNIADM